MTYVFTQPQAMATAATNVAGIGSAVRQANAAAAGSTTSVVAAAQDEVSAAISALFGGYGHEYQALSAQTALFHDQFVQALTSGGNAYNDTEAASRISLFQVGLGILEDDEDALERDFEETEETLIHDVETQVATDERIILSLKKEGE
jgi:hypothetical protein